MTSGNDGRNMFCFFKGGEPGLFHHPKRRSLAVIKRVSGCGCTLQVQPTKKNECFFEGFTESRIMMQLN